MRNSTVVYLLHFKRVNIYLMRFLRLRNPEVAQLGGSDARVYDEDADKILGVGENAYKMTHPQDWWQESVVCLLVARGLFFTM